MIGCNDNILQENNKKDKYIKNLENENNISYQKIINTRASYITSMCYTKTKDERTGVISNPCYSCHTKGKIPNYFNDTNLQKEYSFPEEVLKNPFSNLFKDRSDKVATISDMDILSYVRESNYFNKEGDILLQERLPSNWKGYRPDCYYNFDNEGFDRNKLGDYTLWRAFRYYPFLGTFWPTNGSTDDVLIRLDKNFSLDSEGAFNKDIYKLNLAIVEALIKQKEIAINEVNESLYGIDIDNNGKIDKATKISPNIVSYAGYAGILLKANKVHLAKGLFPIGTEFLHSVRYIDWNERTEHIDISPRMKELRYAKKREWLTYSQIDRVAKAELWETQINDTSQGVLATFRGNYEEGLQNNLGWIYQGFIEDRKGVLRPQTHEETIGCMGCHSHLGATTDSIFSFARKFKGINKTDKLYGWNHWTQKGLIGIPEPKADYLNHHNIYEYSFYLQQNHSANEFRNNDEVKNKFFNASGRVNSKMIESLHDDISLLLFPSKKRALNLNKGYKVMVEEQSYIDGRDANIKPMKNIFKKVDKGAKTSINRVIVKE